MAKIVQFQSTDNSDQVLLNDGRMLFRRSEHDMWVDITGTIPKKPSMYNKFVNWLLN